jgi:PTH1 family peptidyl-tRNA hydrolase
MVVEELASRAGERFRKARFLPAEVCEIREADDRVVLVRARAFMNESGPAYASVARKRSVGADRLIAVHDELDIGFGALRVKLGGSTAGHNGLNSLAQALRTQAFYRVRVGIGRPPGRKDPADFVLEPFSRAELPDVPLLVDRAADAALSIVRDGLAVSQDRFNRAGLG